MLHFDKKEIREAVFLGGGEIIPLQLATDRKTGITYGRQTMFSLNVRSPWVKMLRNVNLEKYDMIKFGTILKKQDNRFCELHLRDLEGREYEYNGNFQLKLENESLKEENNVQKQLIENMKQYILESDDYELRKKFDSEIERVKNSVITMFPQKKRDRR